MIIKKKWTREVHYFPTSWLVNSSVKEWRYTIVCKKTAGKLDGHAYIVLMWVRETIRARETLLKCSEV